MDARLRRALEPVLRDLTATAGPVPARIEERSADPGSAGAMFWSRDGSGAGVQVVLDAPLVDQVVQVTDHVQEWAVEELWGQAPTNWPRCPHHPTTHPLEAQVRDGAAWWACPREGTKVSEVGTLG